MKIKELLEKYTWANRENIAGYLFVTPYVILFMIFTGIPFIASFILAFLNVKFITRLDNLKFVGLNNFIKIFQNKETLSALLRTFQYSIIYVPLIMIVGFILAVLLNKGVHLKNTIRAMVFLPYVSNMVAVAVIFKILLGPKGPIIHLLSSIGMQNPPNLLLDLKLALPTIVCIAVWKGVGLNMIVYLAALQDIPKSLIEAAQIDGANKLQIILKVILPKLSPTTFFLLISSIITSLQNFTVIKALTDGGPGQATTVMSLSIVQTAFTKFQTSYASAQAILVFIIVMVITIIQWRGQKKWVNY
ncbi:carbohydrate ABC transporter permease [Halanaerobium praevalens]|uniref:Carbohydrate ABC transporter membrane protein 1, CUT1 family n=1 Tax=Halanaerobium praevalens (strain ATCC 33744 / DSM 2228 / GSL) TaxID=572479 RepID=E3DRA7_HALPG|nr:sugar ABC transporter permease [Halanaerobium praevalens]ADO77013.1 carbohydrate ABC transporter membrane protein 1, CUT1 family [Halanaerobium praevalens DSM 2228]